VSILLPTYNRCRYLPYALASAAGQTYRNLEIFVVNDGGHDVRDIVHSFNDPRIHLIDRRENRGKPHSLNEALGRARGKYIAYLDDDDVHYPHHVQVLVDALEGPTDCQVAYSDLYKTYCHVRSDGTREIRSKHVEISRDFDRFMMLYFNHVLHVSLMHRRDLLDRTGLYNEDLSILIDWDMTRRLAFFSDFHHTHVITGEFYSPLEESDRISVQRRKDSREYLRNVLAIRTTHPPKPWDKLDELSVILLVDRLDQSVAQTCGCLWRHTFYPYRLYLPLVPSDISRLNSEMPNVAPIAVDPRSSPAERVDVALQSVEGSYVAILPGTLPIEEMWVENPLHALIHTVPDREGFLLENAGPDRWGAVLKRVDLQRARSASPHLSVEASLTASGVRIRRPRQEELPFQFDTLLHQARMAEADGDWAVAARVFEHMAAHHHNELWMKSLAAGAHFDAGNHVEAGRLSRQVNQVRPTVETLLLEAKVRRRRRDFEAAIRLLQQAERGLRDSLPAPVRVPVTGSQGQYEN
jgi:glycosyltransferase involved in cell wall biosynthesis